MSESSCLCQQEDDKEKYKRIAGIIDEYKNKEGSLIQILHLSQGVYGYLPIELQQFIAERTGLPLSEVHGVVTFYSFFATRPRGLSSIKVCMGTACYVKGAQKLVDNLKKILDVRVGETTADGKYTLEVMRCIGACGLAPALMIDDEVFGKVEIENLEAIVNNYTKK